MPVMMLYCPGSVQVLMVICPVVAEAATGVVAVAFRQLPIPEQLVQLMVVVQQVVACPQAALVLK